MLTAGRLSCKVLVPNFFGNSTFVVVLRGSGRDMVPVAGDGLPNLLQPTPQRNRVGWPTGDLACRLTTDAQRIAYRWPVPRPKIYTFFPKAIALPPDRYR